MEPSKHQRGSPAPWGTAPWARIVRHPLTWAGAGLAAVGLVIVILQLGGSRPRAPALVNEPVYQNQQEGFRFFLPDGWTIQARSEFPSGKPLPKERMLVQYKRAKSGGSLIVSMVDLPESEAVADYLEKRLFPKDAWRPAGVERLTLANLPAERFLYKGYGKMADQARETVVIRRGQRAYFFTTLYSANDTKIRDETRKALTTLTW